MQTTYKGMSFFKASLQKVPQNEAHSQTVLQKIDVPRAEVKRIRLTEGEMHHALVLVMAVVHYLSHSLFCHSLSQTEAFLKSRVWKRLQIDVQSYITFNIL